MQLEVTEVVRVLRVPLEPGVVACRGALHVPVDAGLEDRRCAGAAVDADPLMHVRLCCICDEGKEKREELRREELTAAPADCVVVFAPVGVGTIIVPVTEVKLAFTSRAPAQFWVYEMNELLLWAVLRCRPMMGSSMVLRGRDEDIRGTENNMLGISEALFTRASRTSRRF